VSSTYSPTQPLTMREGWLDLVHNTPPTAPDRVSRHDFREWSPAKRRDYNEQRLYHHSRLVIVETPSMTEAHSKAQRLLRINLCEQGARRGLVISGPPAMGKTTIATQFGKAHQIRAEHRASPETLEQGFIPVVYISVPPGTTAKMLSQEVARFAGLPYTPRQNRVEVTDAVCRTLGEAGTSLVIVDEIHNLDPRTREGKEASDHLKYLADRIAATFIYVGVEVPQSGIFGGVRANQIAGRFLLHELEPFRLDNGSSRRLWSSVIAAMEQAIILLDHSPGSLAEEHATYLFERTGGRIGSLSHLVRAAAVEAIAIGREAIDRPLLDSIEVDFAAEVSYRRQQVRERGRRRSKPTRSDGAGRGAA
jgi:Bacterial TniB protein